MKFHELKTWPREFLAIRDGEKRFEVRKNDRNFQRGDLVRFMEFVPDHLAGKEIPGYGFAGSAGYTGSATGPFRILYITVGGALPEGWAAFAVVRLVAESDS